MLTAKEAREKLNKSIEHNLEKEMSYIFLTIESRINIGENFIQLFCDPYDCQKEVSQKHLECLRELGYKVEYTQAVTEMAEVNLDGSITPSGRLMLQKDSFIVVKPADSMKPLMCWKVSW